MDYHQSKNKELQKVIADQNGAVESHKKQFDELRSKINQISGYLNIKTLEVILQQEVSRFHLRQHSTDSLKDQQEEELRLELLPVLRQRRAGQEEDLPGTSQER